MKHLFTLPEALQAQGMKVVQAQEPKRIPLLCRMRLHRWAGKATLRAFAMPSDEEPIWEQHGKVCGRCLFLKLGPKQYASGVDLFKTSPDLSVFDRG